MYDFSVSLSPRPNFPWTKTSMYLCLFLTHNLVILPSFTFLFYELLTSLSPYLLTFYLLSTVIATLDYSQCVKPIENVLTSTKIISDGRVDCVAVWVDFDLTPAVARPQDSTTVCNISSSTSSPSSSSSSSSSSTSSSDDISRRVDDHFQGSNGRTSLNETENVLHQWNDEKKDFPSHLKLNLKFFPLPITVMKNETVLTSCTSFTVGDSDFIYNFKLE